MPAVREVLEKLENLVARDRVECSGRFVGQEKDGIDWVAVGIFGHWVGVRITNNASPFPTDYAIDLPTIAQAVLAATLAVGLGAIVPATRVANTSVGRAMAYE